VGERDTLGVEIGAALGTLGLLLVFLPLFLRAAVAAKYGGEPQRERRARLRRAWAVPGLIALAAADATLGLLTLWGKTGAAGVTAWLLIVLVWLVVGLAGWAVKTGIP
jgi:hypothetical protein